MSKLTGGTWPDPLVIERLELGDGMTARRATAGDLDAFVEISTVTLGGHAKRLYDIGEDVVRAGLTRDFAPALTAAIEHEGRCIAFVVVEDRADELWLDHMVVEPASQGQGLGSRLVRWIQGASASVDKPVTLSVVDGNPARELYARLGFTVDRIEPPRTFMVSEPDRARSVVRDLATSVEPLDDHEAEDQSSVLGWIDAGAPLFRVVSPATPPQHLCAYAVLLDDTSRSIFLIDHVKAGKWLAPGGHVDDGEDPRVTVLREAEEELEFGDGFHPAFGDAPVFLTVTDTVGPHVHTDVSLWFVLNGSEDLTIEPDPREANGARWFALDDDAEWSGRAFDPQMQRFRAKLISLLP